MPQSVNQWKNNTNINDAVSPNSLQSVSAWKSTQPVVQAPVVAPQTPDLATQAENFISNYAKASAKTVFTTGNALLHPLDTLKKLPGMFIKPLEAGIKKASTPVQGGNIVTDAANLFTGFVQAATFPITGIFNIAENIPGAKQVADVISLPFRAIGIASDFTIGKTIDAIPNSILSKETKDVITKPLKEAGATLAEVALGGRALDIIGGKLKSGEKITPEVAKQAMEQAKTEVPKQPVEQPTTQPTTQPVSVSEWQAQGKPVQPIETPKTPLQTEALTHEQRLNNVLNHERDLIKKTRTGSRQQADLKASGFQLSAIKRGIKGEPTTIEMQKAKAKLTSNFVGKKVDVLDIGTGKVTGTSFGKIRVKFSDGSIKSIEPKDIIKTVVSNSDAISYLKDKAINKLQGLENIYGLKSKIRVTKKVELPPEIKPTTKPQDLTFKPTESVSKLAQSLKTKAIKDKMIYAFDKRFRDLPVLEKRIKTEDIAKAREFTLNNPNEAFKVAMGEKPAPAGMLPEDVLATVTDYASATKNTDALTKLTNESGLLQQSRTMGQRIQALSQLNPTARKLGDIKRAREGKVINYDKRLSSTKKTIKSEVNKNNLSPEDTSWGKFLDSITCK